MAAKKKIKLSTLRPNPDNPRYITDERFAKLIKSVKEFPEMMELRPLIVAKDGRVLGGNMRYEALRELGYEQIPASWVMYVDLTKEKEREFIIKDNASFGGYEWETIEEEWADYPLDDWDPDLSGWHVEEYEVEDKPNQGEKPHHDEAYVRFEIVMSKENRDLLYQAIHLAKSKADTDLSEIALRYISNHFIKHN